MKQIEIGEMTLDPEQAHHLRDVLRVGEGQTIEVFDDAGQVGCATVVRSGQGEVVVRVAEVQAPLDLALKWTVASAVPKGQRADWMVEKLSELGTAEFVPLATARGVVLPDGQGKRQRWRRLAEESAKQSRRAGVMKIAELTEVSPYARGVGLTGWYLSTAPGAMPALDAARKLLAWPGLPLTWLTILVGPEGGWTEQEIAAFDDARLMPVSLGSTVLRVETAAVAAASIMAGVVRPLVDQGWVWRIE